MEIIAVNNFMLEKILRKINEQNIVRRIRCLT